MQTNYSPRVERDLAADSEPSISLAHLHHVFRAYRGVIAVSLLALVIGYVILGIFVYLFSPSARVTALPFRLNFEGASDGRYPNGLRFSAAEIVSSPVMQKVYQRNDIGRYLSFDDFSRSMYVLESNPAYNALEREYEARLSDVKLTALDRERIEKEFELKRAALSKNEFALHFQHTPLNSSLPQSMVRSVLVDTLNAWADVAVNEQHVVDYRVPVLSPDVIGASKLPDSDYIPTLLVLRAQLMKVLENVSEVRKLPGAELVRTPDKLSLDEIRFHLEEIVRFRIDPLMAYVNEKHVIKDPTATIRFAENQLAYDQRQLDGQTAKADAMRQTLAVYAQRPTSERDVQSAAKNNGGEAATAVLSESFLDRLVDLTSRSADTTYRQGLTDGYRRAMEATIPLAAAVAYDKTVIEQLRSPGNSPGSADMAYVNSSIVAIRDEVRQLVGKVNEIYKIESGNLRPATQLFTVTAPIATRIDRTISPSRLILGGVLVVLAGLVLTIVGVLLHSRMREEEEAEIDSTADGEPAAVTTPPSTSTPALT